MSFVLNRQGRGKTKNQPRTLSIVYTARNEQLKTFLISIFLLNTKQGLREQTNNRLWITYSLWAAAITTISIKEHYSRAPVEKAAHNTKWLVVTQF